ncbi:hypothetical protein F2Q69_00017673 [Brassica cretica]|uniref:MATH domain-containing protein n=1 Tax=Brassica cretica TaxID=69181 RepID=A0A8S9R331_BRACR|nr:hypothetical protein F2Q69_00017673 [Brassica cretica]
MVLGKPESMIEKRNGSVIGLMETVNGSHQFTIKGYSLAKGMSPGRYIQSDVFSVNGYDWVIYFYPDGKNPEENSTAVEGGIRFIVILIGRLKECIGLEIGLHCHHSLITKSCLSPEQSFTVHRIHHHSLSRVVNVEKRRTKRSHRPPWITTTSLPPPEMTRWNVSKAGPPRLTTTGSDLYRVSREPLEKQGMSTNHHHQP